MYHMKGKFFSVSLAVLLCLGGSLLQAGAETPQSKRDDAESLRKSLHEFLPMLKTCASCNREDNEEQIARLEQKLDGLNKEELASVARAFDVPRFISLVEKLKTETAASGGKSVSLAPQKSPLEPPNYENICPPPRSPNSRVILSFVAIIAVMEEAENASSIICETGASIPFEGIGTPACVGALFVESVAIITRATLTAFLTCIASIDSAEIEAAWKNTVNINDDLTASSEKTDQKFNAIEQRLDAMNNQMQKILDILCMPQEKGNQQGKD